MSSGAGITEVGGRRLTGQAGLGLGEEGRVGLEAERALEAVVEPLVHGVRAQAAEIRARLDAGQRSGP